MNVRLMTLLWFGLVAPLAAAAAAPAPFDDAIRDLGRAWLARNDGVGLSVGVYVNGQRHFYNFGATALDGNKTPTKETIYEIGPLAKTMTGQLLARAIVEGRATANDEVTKYFEEPYANLAYDGEPVRLLHLANMTSQLMDNIPDVSQVRTVRFRSRPHSGHASTGGASDRMASRAERPLAQLPIGTSSHPPRAVQRDGHHSRRSAREAVHARAARAPDVSPGCVVPVGTSTPMAMSRGSAFMHPACFRRSGHGPSLAEAAGNGAARPRPAQLVQFQY